MSHCGGVSGTDKGMQKMEETIKCQEEACGTEVWPSQRPSKVVYLIRISRSMGRFLFLSFCFLICIRRLPKMSKIRWKAGSHFIICGSVCCLACLLPPVPRRRPPPPPNPRPPPPYSVSRYEILLAITYLDGSVACGRVTLSPSHVSVTTVSLASCPLPVSPDASPLCHPHPAWSELINMSRHQQTTTSSHSSPFPAWHSGKQTERDSNPLGSFDIRCVQKLIERLSTGGKTWIWWAGQTLLTIRDSLILIVSYSKHSGHCSCQSHKGKSETCCFTVLCS